MGAHFRAVDRGISGIPPHSVIPKPKSCCINLSLVAAALAASVVASAVGGAEGLPSPSNLAATAEDSCAAEYDCSQGCVAVMGNGPRISRGQAAMAMACDKVYRANYADSASSCAKRTTHCFFYNTPDAFAGVRKARGKPSFPIGKFQRLGIQCPHGVFIDGYLAEKNMTWDGASETFTRHDVQEALSPYWDPKERIGGRPARDPWKKPSSGIFMIAHAVKNRGNKCVHIFGFNFHWKPERAGYKTEHAFQEERILVHNLLRSTHGVFFHPLLPMDGLRTLKPGQLVYGV